jgi:deazaflavin-dependent oxidoreductase (nitroreductase family)
MVSQRLGGKENDMPMPRPLAGLPRYLNPVLTPLAGRLPPLAILHHRGRRSGRAYKTPVQAYRTPQGFVVALACNRNAAWALNLQAADGGEMTRGGRRYQLTRPRRSGPDAQKLLAAWASAMMRALDIEDYLEFDATQKSSSTEASAHGSGAEEHAPPPGS